MSKVKILVPDYDKENLDEMLKLYNKLYSISDDLYKELNRLEKHITNSMHFRKWKNYKLDDEKISVSVGTKSKDIIDKPSLKILLTDEQIKQVITKEKKTVTTIITKRDRERLRKNVEKE